MSSIWANGAKGHVTRVWPKEEGSHCQKNLSQPFLSCCSIGPGKGAGHSLFREQGVEHTWTFGKSGIPIPAKPSLASHFPSVHFSLPSWSAGGV